MWVAADIPDDAYINMIIKNEYKHKDVIAVRNAIKRGGVIYNNKRRFKGIVVRYPPEDLCTYPEYRGKPYFSIEYEEWGENIIGYGTYNPEVLSRYLITGFIMPAIKKAAKAAGGAE